MRIACLLRVLLVAGLAVLTVACEPSGSVSAPVKILPESCNVAAGGRIALTLAGSLQGTPSIQWEATGGLIISTGSGISAELTAPTAPGEVIVTARISGDNGLAVTRSCLILSPDTPTSETPPTATPIGALPIAISEVMANPCGSDDFKKWNQYVELYNYGDLPVDVGGWWLFDPGETGTPDMLIRWDDRMPPAPLGGSLVTNTTVIPPHGFAVILSPLYPEGSDPYRMPYQFPAGTIILTVGTSQRLGDDVLGILGEGPQLDVVVLYIGGANAVQQVVSTYGSPNLGRYPYEIQDNYADNLPIPLHDCSSAERIDPRGQDVYVNWYEVRNGGSPGTAPYLP